MRIMKHPHKHHWACFVLEICCWGQVFCLSMVNKYVGASLKKIFFFANILTLQRKPIFTVYINCTFFF